MAEPRKRDAPCRRSHPYTVGGKSVSECAAFTVGVDEVSRIVKCVPKRHDKTDLDRKASKEKPGPSWF
jgi:hypothetical protein